MKLKNLKNIFITTLISSVSFLVNVLPVRGEGDVNTEYYDYARTAGLPPPTPREEFLYKLKGYLPFTVFPIAFFVVVIFIVRFYKKKKEVKKS